MLNSLIRYRIYFRYSLYAVQLNQIQNIFQIQHMLNSLIRYRIYFRYSTCCTASSDTEYILDTAYMLYSLIRYRIYFRYSTCCTASSDTEYILDTVHAVKLHQIQNIFENVYTYPLLPRCRVIFAQKDANCFFFASVCQLLNQITVMQLNTVNMLSSSLSYRTSLSKLYHSVAEPVHF